ncbi:type II toxin-antitoxin system prevent-host-death family antitoxin [Arthrobacter zhangbolii]|uniref:Antitoxin n=1 Tax=Arthrobacter zhangbolii TaxID=2886936 RepID=A0A9X1M7G7_9MICC|nr:MULTISPECIES: type II toxin-antitoxin system prevent-host-death family antitoxin [Arthrobacter]MCC3271714.1 type II toxin-antitoxin system prevent-host-death family antitoxin [Arthrobacter zhangbolii]MCC3293617.1 type II toxin-antitoxin system prevent-host-death family antitoxin [Arthrobacter zhangbolii]MDN3904785.1 type II toxin-antitoxin system prevent-host-death family antitoxin [Arthrobacter sp. YD2]UON93458.1 type II toxin-antitoxin system prevent-host-death family antitoxin [Arthrobact
MAITATEARRDLARLIERVNDDRIEIEIVSKRGSAVLMSKDEYDSWMETNYLLSSPQNAQRLLASLTSARKDDTAEYEHCEQ